VPIEPRRRNPEERYIEQVLRCLLEHPALADRLPGDEIVSLVEPGPQRELLEALVASAVPGPRIDLDELCERLEPSVGTLARSLAAEDDAPGEETAMRILDDTLAVLRKRSARAKRQALKRRLHEPDADAEALLGEIQRLREEPSAAKPTRIATRH